MDLTRRVVEGSLDLAEAALRRPTVATWATTGTTERGTAAIAVRAPAGGRGSTSAWLHHVGEPVGPLTWQVLGPSNGGGDHVAAVRVEPAQVATLRDGDRLELCVVVDVAPSATTGTYHGLLLAVGAAETALVLRLEVTPAGAP
jgi:hypothetical protein